MVVHSSRFGGWRVGDETTVVEQMLDLEVLDENEMVGDKASVAAPPHGLRTHDGGHPGCGQRGELHQSVGELLGAHVVGVCAELLVAEPRVRRIRIRMASTSETLHPPVVDSTLGKTGFQRLPSEVGVASTTRKPPDVDDDLDPGSNDEIGERIGAERAVPDRSDRWRTVALHVVIAFVSHGSVCCVLSNRTRPR